MTGYIKFRSLDKFYWGFENKELGYPMQDILLHFTFMGNPLRSGNAKPQKGLKWSFNLCK